MSEILQHPRNLCALGGQQSVVAIERAVPIVHAGPGCGFKLHTGLGSYNGFQGGSYSGGAAIVSTNTGEKEVVFGGEARLRSVIDGALKVMNGDLFVVLSGCTSELVGDDTEHIVSEYRQRGIPIVYAATGGFRGNNIIGHEIVANAIIDQLLERKDIVPGVVNVWSGVPYQDAFWAGNLASIRELLTGLGLKPNILFGPNSGGLEAWRQVPAAQFNLVLSSWAGVSIARNLNQRFGTPWLHCPTLPIGGIETSRFLREVQKFAKVDTAASTDFVQAQEASFNYFFERAADFFLEFRWDMPGHFVTIADSFYGIGVSRLLTNEFGLLPLHQFVTDDPPDEFRSSIEDDFAQIAPGISSNVTFTSDSGKVNEVLREVTSAPPIILGSVWDRDIAQEVGGCHLSIAAPMTDRLITSCSYLGYNGGLRLIEDLYSSILTFVQ